MENSSPILPPVFWDPALGGWAVTTYDLVREVLRDPSRFSSEGGPVAENLGAEAMLATDSPVHDAVREVWSAPFSAATALERRKELGEWAGRLLDPMFAKLRHDEVVDLVPIFEAFAGSVVLSLLGLTGTNAEEFQRWNKMILDSAGFTITPDHPLYQERAAAKAQVYAILEAEVRDRRDRLRHRETLGDLVSLIVKSQGRAGITRGVMLDNLFNVFIGGSDTTVRWMGNAVVILHRHPAVLAAVRANPSLLPQALEEVLRLESVTRFAVRMVCAEGVELHGQALPRGDIVYAMSSLANRDPLVFEEPERFDIYRKAKQHFGFSHGMHKCIGMNLARIEAQAFIGRLLSENLAFEIVEVDYGDTSVVRGPQRLLVRAGGQNLTDG
jgi:cytochrome P450